MISLIIRRLRMLLNMSTKTSMNSRHFTFFSFDFFFVLPRWKVLNWFSIKQQYLTPPLHIYVHPRENEVQQQQQQRRPLNNNNKRAQCNGLKTYNVRINVQCHIRNVIRFVSIREREGESRKNGMDDIGILLWIFKVSI